MLRAAAEAVGLDGEVTMARSEELRSTVQDNYEERSMVKEKEEKKEDNKEDIEEDKREKKKKRRNRFKNV